MGQSSIQQTMEIATVSNKIVRGSHLDEPTHLQGPRGTNKTGADRNRQEQTGDERPVGP